MQLTTSRYRIEILYEGGHWNPRAACHIPAAWVAFVDDMKTGELLPKWPCGKTRQEAIENVKREYPDAEIS